MALQNSDNFLVNRSGTSYKVTYEDLNATAEQAVADAAAADAKAQEALDAANSGGGGLPTTGGTMTGAIVHTERTITSAAFDLSLGNVWTCGAITVPNPTNAVNGQSGLIRITSGPVVWGSNFKFPGSAAPTISVYPSIIPYYVQSSSVILMGSVTEGIA